jgi:hypothetical protein
MSVRSPRTPSCLSGTAGWTSAERRARRTLRRPGRDRCLRGVRERGRREKVELRPSAFLRAGERPKDRRLQGERRVRRVLADHPRGSATSGRAEMHPPALQLAPRAEGTLFLLECGGPCVDPNLPGSQPEKGRHGEARRQRTDGNLDEGSAARVVPRLRVDRRIGLRLRRPPGSLRRVGMILRSSPA